MSDSVPLAQLIREAKLDPDLRLAGKDIDRILDAVESDRTDFLEGRTTADIHREIYDSLAATGLPPPEILLRARKLSAYRHVDAIYQLHRGKFVRWIRRADAGLALSNGGIVADVKFGDDGVQVVCRLFNRRHVQYAFDDCLTFQKLSTDEQLILSLYSRPDYAI